MATGWNGPDPSGFSDGVGTHYELGTKYTAVGDVTISHVRVWGHATGAARASRAGKIWSNAGVLLASATMDDTLPSGWTNYALNTPVEVVAGNSVIVSYDVTDTYGATTAGFAYPLASSDGNVSAIERRLNATPDLFPPSGAGNTFYGIDIVYTAGLSGNERPTVGISATAGTLSAAATLTIDDEDPGSVTYAIEWGDGQTSTGLTSLGPHNHTYTTAGMYAIMVTATDSGGLSDSAAAAVTVRDTLPTGLAFEDIVTAVADHAAQTGMFAKVNKAEPKNAPGGRLTAAIWAQAISPADSGLAVTSVRLVLMVRVYTSMIQDPPDAIDPAVVRAVDRLMDAYSGDFALGGLVRCVDLLGMRGIPLSAQAGYLPIDNKLYRVMDITLPLILNDVWEQEA
jgi:PKD repeat protein